MLQYFEELKQILCGRYFFLLVCNVYSSTLMFCDTNIYDAFVHQILACTRSSTIDTRSNTSYIHQLLNMKSKDEIMHKLNK